MYYKYPIGLANFNLNCYMNSLLQCLYYCVEFRDEFLKIDIKDSQPISKCLQTLMIGLKNCKANYLSPKEIKKELNKYELFKDGKEADVTDLLDQLFYSIINELNEEESICGTVNYEEKTFIKSAMFNDNKNEVNFNIIINKIFLGFYEKEYKCPTNLCLHKKYSFQNEYKLVFPLEEISNKKKKNLTLYDCFDYCFLNKQKNIEKCEKNGCKENLDLIEKIYEAPNILIIILDRGPNKNYKETIYFDEYIDISNYIDDDQKSHKKYINYKLIGVITHLGYTGYYGHYISFCLCDDNNFYCFDDSRVTLKAKRGGKKKNSITSLYEGTSYVLFYQKMKENEKIDFLFYDNTKLKGKIIYSLIEKQNKINIQIIRQKINQIFKKYNKNSFIYQNKLIWKDKDNNNTISIDFDNNCKKHPNCIYVEYSISNLLINKNNNFLDWHMEWKNDENTLKHFLQFFEVQFINLFL